MSVSWVFRERSMEGPGARFFDGLVQPADMKTPALLSERRRFNSV